MSSGGTATWGSGRHQPAETTVEIKQTGATTRHREQIPGPREDAGDDPVPQLLTFKTERGSHVENQDAKTTTTSEQRKRRHGKSGQKLIKINCLQK